MKKTEAKRAYDVVVLGGGPAGMMAAGRAGTLGASVLLLEKNPGLGKKLLISGGGRSNVTNAEFDTAVLLEKYKSHKKFLHSPFSQFTVKDTFNFFESHGMEIKVEEEKRAFPKSNTARSVLHVLEKFMKEGKVEIQTSTEVKSLVQKNDHYIVTTTLGEEISAKKIVMSTGGLSHPETGSTGDGFQWLEKFGADVGRGNAALVPIRTKESWGHKLSGLAFTEARVEIRVDGKLIDNKDGRKTGKILFTHTGLSGPTILNMSKLVGWAIEEGTVTLRIDIFPKEDVGSLDRRLQSLFVNNLNKKIKNVLKEFLPASLVPASLQQNSIDGSREVNSLKREERRALCVWLKSMVITPVSLMGKDKAVVTSGGINLSEVNMRTMESKKLSGLYVVGDILDIDRPSGGYSLQLCWTSGWVAGTSAAKK